MTPVPRRASLNAVGEGDHPDADYIGASVVDRAFRGEYRLSLCRNLCTNYSGAVGGGYKGGFGS